MDDAVQVVGGTKVSCAYAATMASDSGDRHQGKAEEDLTLYIRSPEAMLYYLGEIARVQLSSREGPERWGLGDGDNSKARAAAAGLVDAMQYAGIESSPTETTRARYTMFSVLDSADATCSGITVKFDSGGYCVPRSNPKNRSTHVLSLMNQIVALQNKGTDLPTTTTVRVVP